MGGEGRIINLPIEHVFYLKGIDVRDDTFLKNDHGFEVIIVNKDFTRAKTLSDFLHGVSALYNVSATNSAEIMLFGYEDWDLNFNIRSAKKLYEEFCHTEKDKKSDRAVIKTTGDLIKFSNFLKNKFTSKKENNSYLNF